MNEYRLITENWDRKPQHHTTRFRLLHNSGMLLETNNDEQK